MARDVACSPDRLTDDIPCGSPSIKWVDDPAVLELDTNNLKKNYNNVSTKASRERKASVNPHGNYEFIGRGPVQVTH
jgi:hypothetical protein